MEQDDKSFENRLINVLSRHKIQFIDAESDDIVQFFNTCGDEFYQLDQQTKTTNSKNILIQLLNDFDTYLVKQKANEIENYAEEMYNKLCNKSKLCNATTCRSIQRHGLRQSKENTHTKPEDVYHHSIDTMHIELYHAIEMGYRLLQSEKDEIKAAHDDDEMQLSQIVAMAKKQKQFRKTTKRDDDTNEEKRSQRMRTDMAADTTRLLLMERLVVYLHTRGMDARILCDFLDALIEQEYDTDSIEYDGSIALKSDSSSQLTLNLKLECNLRTILKQSNGNEKQFRKVTRYLFESDVHTKVYGHGIRFYYWEFYRNTKGDEDTPVIFTNMDNISITSQQHWADPGNPGYKTRDWYIEPKFEDMRDEILS
eukprot:982806_1